MSEKVYVILVCRSIQTEVVGNAAWKTFDYGYSCEYVLSM